MVKESQVTFRIENIWHLRKKNQFAERSWNNPTFTSEVFCWKKPMGKTENETFIASLVYVFNLHDRCISLRIQDSHWYFEDMWIRFSRFARTLLLILDLFKVILTLVTIGNSPFCTTIWENMLFFNFFQASWPSKSKNPFQPTTA